MYRTADEALYDVIVRPIDLYEAPSPWRDVTEEEEALFQKKEICAECRVKIEPFDDTFFMDAGHGCTFKVTDKSGLCKACFDKLRNKPPVYRENKSVKINYAFGSSSLITYEETDI